MDKISVMICDDSALMRNLIGRIIADYDGLEVVAKAENGQDLLDKIPVYKLLGGARKQIVTDITISVNEPEQMAHDAIDAIIAADPLDIYVKAYRKPFKENPLAPEND